MNENEKEIINGANIMALQFFTIYSRMLQLTGSPEESIRLTQSLFTAILEGSRTRKETGGFTVYWDRR